MSSTPAAGSGGPICLVHLVRAVNGLDPFTRFVEAMRRCPAGVDHELVLALKGFDGEHDAEPYLSFAQDLGARPLFLADVGYDLGSYLEAASRLSRTRYCFVNSFSEPLVEGWLAKLDGALSVTDVGMAGASASWNSSRSWVLYAARLPSPYSRLLPKRGQTREVIAQRDLALYGQAPGGGGGQSSRLMSKLKLATRMLTEIPVQIRDFESFPAHHLRTNAFTIAHATIERLRLPPVREKTDAYALESGRRSLTRQVQQMGLRTVLVDREGHTYDQDEWPRSSVFWQGSQQGLLVADNQTRLFASADRPLKELLRALAWGTEASRES